MNQYSRINEFDIRVRREVRKNKTNKINEGILGFFFFFFSSSERWKRFSNNSDITGNPQSKNPFGLQQKRREIVLTDCTPGQNEYIAS